ncbi:MAG: hypothetical protein JST25_06785 [Actinobacteria bacterium]|nr:hypothetical protein [Actinomycetota bacterium]
MAARRSTNARAQQARVQQERSRLHTARQTLHADGIRRRVRDNTVAVVAGTLIVVGAVVSQVVHAEATAPAPKPSPSSTPTLAPEAPLTPQPTATETPAG